METQRESGIRGALLRGGTGGVVIKVAQVLLTFGLTTLLARACGPEGYGVYVFVFAVLQLLGIPGELGMSVLLVREVAAYAARGQWGELRGIMRRGRQTVGVASVGLGLVALAVVWALSRDGTRGDERMIVTFAAGAALLPLLTLTNLHAAALRGFGQVVNGQLPGLIIRPGGFLLLVLAAFVAAGGGQLQPQRVMALHVAAAAAAFVTGWFLLRRRVPAIVKQAPPVFETRRWARSSVSLTFIAGLQIVNSQTDIVMLGLFKTPDVVGIYRVAVQCSLVVALGLDIANMVVSPIMSRLYSDGDMARLQKLTKLSARVVLAASVPVVLLYAFFGEAILVRVFGIEFGQGLVPLYILAAGQVVNAAAGAVVMLLTMTGRESSVVRGFVLSGILNVVLNYLFIPRWGMVGAASATGICLLVWNVYLGRSAVRDLGVSVWALGPGRTMKAERS